MVQLEVVLSIVRNKIFEIILFEIYLCNLVLNEINQYAHRLDEKPAYFKLADVCQPVCIE